MSIRRQAPADDLASLVNKTFNAYRCTPLYNFRHDQRALNKYAIQLARALCNGLRLKTTDPDNLPPDTTTPTGSRASDIKGQLHDLSLEPLPVREWDYYDHPAIEISISLTVNKTARSESIYLIPSQSSDIGHESFCSYPLFLFKASPYVVSEVVAWFQKAFDCTALPLHIPGTKLESMVEWWCSHLFDMPASESQRVQMAHTQTYRYQKLGLVFTVPQIQTISDICIDIRTEDLMNVYGIVRASKLTMMEAIHEHIYNTMRLKLSSLVLIRIGLPVVFVTHEGKLKFIPNSPREHVLKVLEDLCSLAS